MASSNDPYPAIEDYAFIGDCHSVALISRTGSIDWACMPRIDRGSCFGRLLDWRHGGYCSISPTTDFSVSRRYIDDTLVLETRFDTEGGAVRVIDCLTMTKGGARNPHHRLLRIVEGIEGKVALALCVAVRFDYGQMRPWVRRHARSCFTTIGGDDGLIIRSDTGLETNSQHDLTATFTSEAGARHYLSIQYARPELLDPEPPRSNLDADKALETTISLWRQWASQRDAKVSADASLMRSALVLKALNYAPTGAIAAAATTSLPESPGNGLNWDYRFSWIRDSWLTVRALGTLGFYSAANGFRRFIQRSSAGHGDEIQLMYGVGGERRLTEVNLDYLEGYRGARPVRIGNAASCQLQLDMYGELLELAWQWAQRGHTPDDDYWAFLIQVVDGTVEKWCSPDQGIWEIRGRSRHFVFSKVMCWVALNRGIQLAHQCKREAPIERWRSARDAVRLEIEQRGYNNKRNTFVQAFDGHALDAALLLLPTVEFVAYDDERMIGTVDAIMAGLDRDGLILRYRDKKNDNPFLACTFWLVECLARQGRLDLAREYFDRAMATASDLGLFSEEYDTHARTALGNFPQALTHLAHISAALALNATH